MTDISSAALNNIVHRVLDSNPQLKNSALAGTIEANITNFRGSIKISDCSDSNQIAAKKIEISPYKGFWSNLWASVKRFFRGISFASPPSSENLSASLSCGRRVTIICPLNKESRAETIFELSRKSLFQRIHDTVFGS